MIFNCEWNMECPLNPYCPVDLIIPQILFLIITACFMCQTSPYLQVCLSFKSYIRILSIKRSVYYIIIIIPTRLLSNSIVTWNLFPYQRDVKQFDTQRAAFFEGEQRWKKKTGEFSSSAPPPKKKPGFVKFSFPACMIVPNVNTCFLLWISSILKV